MAKRKSKSETAANLEKVYNYFPRLKTRRSSQADYTSGGEQQMCAVGRGLMALPRLLMFDEPSLGLSPILVEEVFNIVKRINKEGVTVLLVEQNVRQTLAMCDRAYVLDRGRVALTGTADEVRNDPRLLQYLAP